MSIIKNRKNVENHITLGEAVPLKVPFVLLIDPCNLCNIKCKFCPSGDLQLIKETGRYQGMMNFELYKKIIDDLDEFEEPIRALRLYKEGEPLLNPLFADMVKYAKDSKLVQRIDTTTNGTLLNPELNRKIVNAGLDQIDISINGVSAEQIYYYTRKKIDFNKYIENITDLYENRGNCEISIKGIKENLNENEQRKFFDLFGNISNRIFLEHISPDWPGFSFHQDIPSEFKCGNYGQEIIYRKVCPCIFYTMVINASGKASVCLGDWPNKSIAGDLKHQSVKDVWTGNILNTYRIKHLRGERGDYEFCRNCGVPSHSYGSLENLDPYAEDILKRMKT
jgi:MoaA/NifB/PqqE/SkfB family radical SAM enzyme